MRSPISKPSRRRRLEELFLRQGHTDACVLRHRRGTLNGFIATTEAVCARTQHLAIGQPTPESTASPSACSTRVAGWRSYPRTIIAAVEVACWDSSARAWRTDPPLLGGQCATRTGLRQWRYRTSGHRKLPDAAKAVLAKGFKAFKLDPFGVAQGFLSREELDLSYDICRTLRDKLPTDTRGS